MTLGPLRTLRHLFQNNRAWAERIGRQDPGFFSRLAQQQSPRYLWIGCSDSRVPANQIIGLRPGEVFVHRNLANLVLDNDLNCMSVLQFAVDILKIPDVIVCGHYGCAGVRAILNGESTGLSAKWLCHIEEVRETHRERLGKLRDNSAASDRLCELNVIEQVANVCRTSAVRKAWNRGQEVVVHGWIYSIKNGLLRDLNVTVTRAAEAATMRARAISAL